MCRTRAARRRWAISSADRCSSFRHRGERHPAPQIRTHQGNRGDHGEALLLAARAADDLRGGLAGFDANNWYGQVPPTKTQCAIIDQLNAEVTKILNMPDVRTTLFNQGLDPAPGTPEQFGAYIKSERAKWAKVIKESGAKPQ